MESPELVSIFFTSRIDNLISGQFMINYFLCKDTMAKLAIIIRHSLPVGKHLSVESFDLIHRTIAITRTIFIMNEDKLKSTGFICFCLYAHCFGCFLDLID